MQDLSEYLNFAKKIAFDSGQILSKHFGNIKSINQKSTNIDLVTNADLESEAFIVKAIQNKFPDHTIITEENQLKAKNSDFRWVIDPLDGTTNFVHNLPIFAVSIGLQYKKKTIVGVVYNPAADKLFFASLNNGAYLNNNKISVSSSKTLSESLIVTGFPYLHDKKWEISFILFKDFYSRTQGVRRLGAAALDLCFVAMGRFEAFYEFHLQPWDICAGALIVQESGGVVTDWDGTNYPKSGIRILSSNRHIHNEMLKVLKNDNYKIFLD